MFKLLDAVEATEGPSPSATVVAAVLGIDQPRVSRLVAKAVDAGLLRRKPNGRVYRLALTVDGRAVLALIHAFRRSRIADATVGWSARDRSTFAHLLAQFVDDLANSRSLTSER
jgi:DNA-binding MarR family transcriptional regulator